MPPPYHPPPHATPFPRPSHPPRLSPHPPPDRSHCMGDGWFFSYSQRSVSFSGRVFGYYRTRDVDRVDAWDAQRQIHPGPGRGQDHSSYWRKAHASLFGRAFFRSELVAHRGHDHIRTDLEPPAHRSGNKDRPLRHGRQRPGLFQPIALACLEDLIRRGSVKFRNPKSPTLSYLAPRAFAPPA